MCLAVALRSAVRVEFPPLRLSDGLLADTSVWIRHLREPEPRLLQAAMEQRLLIHPMVLGELVCGNLPERPATLAKLRQLEAMPGAEDGEVHHMIEGRGLSGRGVGWIDFHLLSACVVHQTTLWTRDKRLAAVAAEVLGEEKVQR